MYRRAMEDLIGEGEEGERSIKRLRGAMLVGGGGGEAMLTIGMIRQGMRRRGVISMIFD